MKVGLNLVVSQDVENASVILNLSDKLEFFFINKFYGEGLKMITIGIYCLNVPIGFEKFSKLPNPKFIKGKKTFNPDGINITVEDCFEYCVKIDYKEFQNVNKDIAKKILASNIIESLSIFDKYENRIRNFNFVEFKNDFKIIIEQNK